MQKFALLLLTSLIFTQAYAKEHVFATQRNWSATSALDERVDGLTCQLMFKSDGSEFGLIYKEKTFFLWAASNDPAFSNDQDFVLLHIKDGSEKVSVRIEVARTDTEVLARIPDMINLDQEESLIAFEIILGTIIMGANDGISIEFPEFEVWDFDVRNPGLEKVRSRFMQCTSKYDELLDASGGKFRSEKTTPMDRMLNKTPLIEGF